MRSSQNHQNLAAFLNFTDDDYLALINLRVHGKLAVVAREAIPSFCAEPSGIIANAAPSFAPLGLRATG